LLSLFLGVALTARRLAMNSELDILMATGVSPWRIRRSAMLLAVLTTLMVLGVRGWIEPVGEARLDRLLGAIRAGDYGAAIRPGTPIIIGRHATLLAERIDPTTHRLYRVFVHSGAQTATAAMGRMLHDRRDRIVLALTDGTLATHAPGEAPRSTGFGTLTLVFPSDRPAPALPGAAERLNRLTISALTAVTGADRDAAIAALGGRLVFAGFCLILPVLGFLLGAVPKRRRSAIGLFLGVALIVLFLRMAAMIEADLAAIALPAFAALLGGWAGAVLLLDARLARHGPGSAEAWLATIAARAMRPIRH
jgi:lipopolysaccharide export system permease protein